ncbi:MAG TPA: IS200/IS605 family transposase [Candidatus Sulfotelmatobacter sp.]|nr:IS200/IS605 family transposase [Candidatus Sulfotelmatobacter sp.]
MRQLPHTYAQIAVHVIFSTKDRCKLIPRDFQSRLWAYTAGVCKNHGMIVHAVGGMDDHMHLLIQIPPSLPLAKVVLAIKSNSSRWANEQGRKFAWQQGYAAFSVSASLVPAVVRYIQTQESHHRKMTFDAEWIALLKKHGVEFDPKFVFG